MATGLEKISFHSNPKERQTTTQLHSSHVLVTWCTKFSKPGFKSRWTVNFQMFQIFKLDLEKPEEPEIKLPMSVGSSEKQESSRKTSAAAAAAKSPQSCPTLCNPMNGSPPGSPVPGILQARTLEWVAISFSNTWKWKVKVKSLSCVWLFPTPWTTAHQAPPS